MSSRQEINFDNIKDLVIVDGELHWRGNKLKTVTVQHFALSFWQWITGAVIALGAIAAPAVTYFVGLESICKITDQRAPLCEQFEMGKKFPTPPPSGVSAHTSNAVAPTSR